MNCHDCQKNNEQTPAVGYKESDDYQNFTPTIYLCADCFEKNDESEEIEEETEEEEEDEQEESIMNTKTNWTSVIVYSVIVFVLLLYIIGVIKF